jgi:signal transduction histidine kinase
MQTADFNIKEALKKIIKSNDKTQWIGSIASVIILFIWYIVYYVYMPDQRLVLFVIHCFATLLPLMLILNRKKLGLDSAHCRLIALSSIATLNGYMINICPSEIYAVVFLATCSIFLGSGLLAFWSMNYYIAMVIFSAFLNLLFYNIFGTVELSSFMLYNVFPLGLTALLGAFLLNNRMSTLIKQERIKWSLEKSEKELSLLNQKTAEELDFLVYSISHDLRSPVLSVKGLISLISDFEKLAPEQINYLKMAEGSVERLDQTIYDIVDFADNANLTFKAETFDIRETVQEIFDDLKFLAKVPIDFQIEIEGSDEVYADRKRIKTIIKNLASNAVKYSRKNATDAFVKFKMIQNNQQIEFEIADNGIGIPELEQEKIFEMFYRYATDTNGSGLGLFIVKEVLAKIGGRVELHSTLSKGSVFKVSLPLQFSNLNSGTEFQQKAAISIP